MHSPAFITIGGGFPPLSISKVPPWIILGWVFEEVYETPAVFFSDCVVLPSGSRAECRHLVYDRAQDLTLPSPPRPQSIKDGVQIQKPQLEDYVAMLDNLPGKAYAKPKKARKVLVLAHAAGFVHSSIPLAGETVKAMGEKTGAWSTTITYDPADITAEKLAGYDAIFS